MQVGQFFHPMIIEKPEELKVATERRVAKMKKEFAKKPTLKAFVNREGYKGIIAQVAIPFMALCEHHKCSFEGMANIAYIPKQYLIGLSKLARVAEYYLNPTVKTLQERATISILKHLQVTLEAAGLMVVIKARHSCVAYRGVKKPSVTITSEVSGIFSTDVGARAEFLSLINNN